MSLPERARPESVVVRHAKVVGQVCLVTVAALTSAVVAGWTFRLRWLAALVDRSHPMKLNPAVALLAYSCVCLAWRAHPRSVIAARTAKLVGVMVAALGLVTIAQYVFGISLGIDEMFREDRWSVGGLAPGRAAPQTAVILIALGVALALPNRMRRLRDGLIVASIAAALFAVLGELAHVNKFVVIGGTYGIPIVASVVIILVALGLVLTSQAADTTLELVIADSPGGVLLRRFMTVLAVPALVGAILYALAVGSRALDERSAGWLVTVAALTAALILGWRAAITVDDLDDARTAVDERFRVAFHSGPLGRAVLDLRDGAPRFVEVNDTLASLLGYSVEELLQVDPISLIDPDDVTREFDACAAYAITGDRTIDYESRRRHRSGNWIPVRLTGEMVVDPSGAPRYAMVSIDDLRVKLATSAALEASRQLALQQAAMATATADMARHTLTDTIAADVLSFAAAKLVEILSADIAAVYTPGPTGELSLIAQSGVEIGLLATAALGASTETVVTDCVQQGATIVVDDWTQQPSQPAPPFVAAQGARSGLIVPLNGSDGCGGAIVVASIAQRAFVDEEIAFVEGLAQLVCLAQHTARANAQLLRSERTLTAFVENAPAAVSLLDDQGRYVLVNREAERVMGTARSAILGRYRADIPAYARRAAGEQERDLPAADARESTTFEETINFDDGDHSYISVKFPLIDDAGDLFGVGGISTDVTPLKRLQAEADRAWRETTRRLAIAVEFRDEETGSHIDRMAAYCELIAVHLGLGADYAATIRRAAPLHDAGKIAVPDRILLKPGTLTSAELKIMRSHAEIGYQLLAGTGSPELDIAASIAWTHHERIDGTGYPRQLSGEDIPIEGRIASVADVFDALTSERIYHTAVSTETAAEYLRDGRGTIFDPAIVDALVEHLDEADTIRHLYADEHPRPQPYRLHPTGSTAPLAASRDDRA